MYVKTINYTSPNCAQEFAKSLRETGFAVLSSHPIAQNTIEAVYADWKEFFKSEEKNKYLFDSTSVRQTGYLPFKSENAKGYPAKDLKEMYHYRGEEDLPQRMGRSTQTLLNDLTTLAQEVLSWLEKDLPEEISRELSMPLHQMIQDSDMTLLRILHYPPILEEDEEGAVRAAAHEDIDLLTILPAATTPGLQVQDKRGNWHVVACDYGSLVFNAGDMLQMATKEYYKSTTHRVINPIGKEALISRYSLPLFFHARREVRISETHTAESYLSERLRELGFNLKAA
jgi:isopenicillin N synthase-like dioxygenase